VEWCSYLAVVKGMTMRRNGFTLIELLVVIAIIALLLSILVPSLAAVKELATVANCLSNQKNIALAFIAYCQDNDDNMCSGYVYDDMNVREVPSWVRAPLVYDVAGSFTLASDSELNTETRQNGLREGAIYPYLNDVKVFHCPGDKRLTKGGASYFSENPPGPINIYQIYRSYSMPDFYIVNGSNQEKKLGNIGAAGSKLLFVEDQYPKWYNIDSWSYYPGRQNLWDPLGNYHNKSCTFAFADGHAEHYKWRDKRTWLYMENRDTAPVGRLQEFIPRNEDLDWLDRHYPWKTRFKTGQD